MNSCWKMKIQNEKPLGHSASRSSNISKAGSPTSVNAPCSFSRTSVSPSSQDICRICHCEGDEGPLITPCHCTGSLRFVHQFCLQQWIKSSDTRCCELCKYEFIMETKLKPLRKWEKLQMTASERRKIVCSVTFHVIAITCVVWSLYVLIDRTADEIKRDGRIPGILECLSDQAGGGGHRVHRRTGVHVRPVQSLHSSMAETKGLQPGHICPEPAGNV
eukprot:XP_011601640.1 PREDICTED: E3 ubiquitin-protein ligase MARCH8-like isoform X2 [Takifugu rubripes]